MRLAAFLASHNLTDSEFAQLVGQGCSASAVKKLRKQQDRPSLDRAYAIELATDGAVTLADWIYVPRRRAYDRAYDRRKRRQRAQRDGSSTDDHRVAM